MVHTEKSISVCSELLKKTLQKLQEELRMEN